MFCKASLITVALALMASAAPSTAPTKKGITIPLQKRSSVTNADGTFNPDKALVQTVKTIKWVFSFHLSSTRNNNTDLCLS